jgi:hypothetical protein
MLMTSAKLLVLTLMVPQMVMFVTAVAVVVATKMSPTVVMA